MSKDRQTLELLRPDKADLDTDDAFDLFELAERVLDDNDRLVSTLQVLDVQTSALREQSSYRMGALLELRNMCSGQVLIPAALFKTVCNMLERDANAGQAARREVLQDLKQKSTTYSEEN